MDQILSMSREEQATYYREAAARSKTIKSPNIMEKDYWVCWTLKQIFDIEYGIDKQDNLFRIIFSQL